MNPAFIRRSQVLVFIACSLALTACRSTGKKTVETAPAPRPVDQAEKGGSQPARNERGEPKDPRPPVAPITAPVAPVTKAPAESQPPTIAPTPAPAPIPSPTIPAKTPTDVTTGVAPQNTLPKELPPAPTPVVQPAIPAPVPGATKVDGNPPPEPKASLPVTINPTPGAPLPGRQPEILSLSRTPGAPEPIRGAGANERAIGLAIAPNALPGGTGSKSGTAGPSLSRLPGFEDRPAPAGSRSLGLPAILGGSIAGSSPSPPSTLALPTSPGSESGRGTTNTNGPTGNSKTLGFDPLLQERKTGTTWREQQLLKQAAEQKIREEEQQKLKDAFRKFLFKDGTNR